MKSNNATAAQAETKGSAIVAEIAMIDILFAASSKDVTYTLKIAVPVIEGSAEFTRKLYCATHAQVVYRSSTGKGLYPEDGGNIDLPTFIKAVEALKFQGEEVPTKEDKTQAETWLKAIKAGVHKPGAVAKAIEEKYGYKIAEDLEGLTQHFFRVRLKKREAAKDASLDAL